MAKKKKLPGKRSKKSSWYPQIILFLCLIGLALAAYCYFSPQSRSIPVIASRDYPKRTPGVPVKQTTYAVYDRLAGQSKHDAARLLPPDEVPDWNPLEPEEKPVDAAVPNQSSTTAVPNQISTTAVPPKGDAKAQKTLISYADKKPSTTPSTSVKQTAMIKQLGKPQTSALSKKNGGKSDTSVKSTPSTKPKDTPLRLQIGPIQSEAQKAEKTLQNIRKKGKIPPHMRPMIQKATIKGKTVYRVILVGHCSEKMLKEYQRHLG
jgi:hypothetical protein